MTQMIVLFLLGIVVGMVAVMVVTVLALHSGFSDRERERREIEEMLGRKKEGAGNEKERDAD